VAADPAAQSRLDLHLRLGRHEPGRRQGGGGHRGQDGPRGRQLVDGHGDRRDSRRRRRQGLQIDGLHRSRRRIQSAPGHLQARVRQGKGRLRQRSGQGRRGALQPDGRQRDAQRRGDSDGDDQVRQQAAHRRAGPLGLRKPQRDRQAPRGDGHEGHDAPAPRDLREPRGQRPRVRPAVGRQKVECRLRLDRADSRRRAAEARGGGRRRGAKKLNYTMRDCTKEK